MVLASHHYKIFSKNVLDKNEESAVNAKSWVFRCLFNKCKTHNIYCMGSHPYERLLRIDQLVTKIDYAKFILPVVYMDFLNNANIIILVIK